MFLVISIIELMAMYIEKLGIDLAAVYRPLNNHFLNPIMANINISAKNKLKGIEALKNYLKTLKMELRSH